MTHYFNIPKKQPKPSTCPCGERFVKQGLKPWYPYHSPQCKSNHVKGNIAEEKLHELSTKVLFDIAVGVCHEYIRERDKDLPCISCNKKYTQSNPMQAGHYYKAELYSGVIFDERNINGECEYCNCLNPDHLVSYAVGMHKRYPSDVIHDLDLKANITRNFKYSGPELIDLIHEYRNKLEQLKK